MKIVCDACQAKYSISDDKVQGKVFKIRCKKCSNIIVVRGGASVAEPAPQPPPEKDTRVYDYGYDGGDRAPGGDEAVWHVVINQDQVGPMTAVDVQRRFTTSEIDAETYIWREGFPDWLPLAQVDTFAGLLGSSGAASLGAAAAAPRGGGAEAVAAMFSPGEDAGPARSDPGDLFASASASSAHSDDDGGDLFGGKPVAAQASQGAKLRGERNENSVLFSLNNLAQLASDKPAPAPRPGVSASPAPGAATGPSSGEGSGLIDIRSMASAYLGGPGGAPKPVSASIGSIDDLPVFGGGGFTEPAVIVPISARANSNKLLYALIGSVGLLAVAAVVVVVVMISGKPSAQAVQSKPDTVASAEPRADVARPAGNTPEPAADKAAAGSSAGDSAAGSTAAPAAGATAPGTAGAAGGAAAATGDARTVKAAPPTEAAPHTPPATAHKATTSTASAQPKPPTPAKPDKVAAAAPPPKETPPARADKGGGGGDCDEVSCVLNSYEGACCAKFRKGGGGKPAAASGGSAPKAGGDLPDSLDRTMIADGVAKVKARAQACGDKSPAKGQVKVSVKVGPDGSVTGVSVKNTPDPALGNCVAGVMQGAKFSRTQSGGSFAYPFQF
jgi:predicted Zn finger-like uncharacterized protein